ncbi:MAG: preprotein translocase subunit SecG [Gammaproteobacteria bacterium]|nr:MAG: preprotein translocase subunit SecG [Gammaproteobacteria bacterium]
METIILSVHVVAAAALIGLVLIQQGQGADAGAAFGSGASQTLFGSRGAGSFFTRATTTLAIVFFLTSLSLAWITARSAQQESVLDRVDSAVLIEAEQASIPVVDAPEKDMELPVIPE